jgi:UDP-N-acetylglucosamine--N-acetylmuramyl-(pentapeptide) pyrophosphoryl-undecaprenol N-acetylglucosamine transferase
MPAARPQADAPHNVRNAVILAGGGSGGHISPGLAIAEALRELDPCVRAIFVCSERPIDALMLGEADERFLSLPAQPFSLRPDKLLRFYRTFQASRNVARGMLQREGARCVAALGGFVAAPVMCAARDLKLPRVLINLDDPPGKANRMMALMATTVLSAIEVRSPGTSKFKYQPVGFPVRNRSIAPGDALECRSRLGLDPAKPVLLVTGASQGAASLNQMMIALVHDQPEHFRGWQVLHLCGEGEVKQSLEHAYAEAGIAGAVLPFLHEMGLAWGAAEVALSRAGANSVAEVAVNCVPSVFLPYPYHKDEHQRRNAEPLEKLGGAAIMTDHIDPQQNLGRAGRVLVELLTNEPRRRAMQSALQANRPANASHEIAAILLAAGG